ncbi:MAG: NAD(P)-dependent oxidoreductase [Bacteroidales bacterium]|nr:NAD(P)-dependent oxidoreductase [Bacteroidales bacterium]
MKSLLVIGAGGFIGGFICQQGLKRGYDTWAGVRASTSRQYLDDDRLHFATFDYDDPNAVAEALQEYKPESGKWDYIIWNLGATKAAHFQDFNRVNYQYLRTFVEQLTKADMLPERFLYMSSLSALGMDDEKGYTPMDNRMVPNPNTRYGLSKIKAETFLEMQPSLDWIIFRPTGVYGPHEKDYLMMIEMIDKGIDVGVGFKKQMLTFIYVDDLVDAMFDAIAAGVSRKKYIISEDRAYTQKEFREIVKRHLGKKHVLSLKLPNAVVYLASYAAEMWGKATMKPSTLNRDKFKIMRQRNWQCDISDAQRDFGFAPKHSLDKGIEITVKHYLKEKSR